MVREYSESRHLQLAFCKLGLSKFFILGKVFKGTCHHLRHPILKDYDRLIQIYERGRLFFLEAQDCIFYTRHKTYHCVQCDQIGRFIGLWATFRAISNN